MLARPSRAMGTSTCQPGRLVVVAIAARLRTLHNGGAVESLRHLPAMAVPGRSPESLCGCRIGYRVSAIAFAAGVWPKRAATLEVRGRRSGRVISFPVVIADYEDERYLVAMLGEKTNWVRNVRAADGRAVLRHGRRENLHLEEVAIRNRPAILRRYLALAPGARPHITIDRHSPLEDFGRIAHQIPVFRITTVQQKTSLLGP